MKNKTIVAKIIESTAVAIIIFALLSLLSYFLTIDYRVNFKLGIPFTFYFQYLKDGRVFYGTIPLNLIIDALATWTLTTICWLFLMRKK